MRRSRELCHAELVTLVEVLQQLLYLDVDPSGRKFWNPDKSWDGADLCDQLAHAMAELGLVPQSVLEIPDCRPKEESLDDHDA